MISSIESQNFKGFRHLRLSGLGRFHVLVGPNGSGKSTFFEVIEFIKDLLLFDVQEAVSRRNVASLRDLTFDRNGGTVKFWITLEPSALNGEAVAYHLSLVESAESGARIASEYLKKGSTGTTRDILFRTDIGSAHYLREDEPRLETYFFGEARGALTQVPADEQRFRTANLVKKLLTKEIHALSLDSRCMGTPCPPSLTATQLLPDGRNLARVAGRLLRADPEEWFYHLRLALEDLDSISWRQREDDRAEYLVIRYKDGLEIPSWLASFGTLRTLALTLPAFLPDEGLKLYLFEEPENGIHPKAVEIVMSAIKSIPNAQTFVTTHSPIVVQDADVDDLLLFSKKDREVIVQHGKENPVLRDWDGVPDLGTVIASRVLG